MNQFRWLDMFSRNSPVMANARPLSASVTSVNHTLCFPPQLESVFYGIPISPVWSFSIYVVAYVVHSPILSLFCARQGCHSQRFSLSQIVSHDLRIRLLHRYHIMPMRYLH